MNVPIIVLRPQSDWHADATIEGNRTGFEQLKSGIEAALSVTLPPDKTTVFTSGQMVAPDGEYFMLNIRMHTDESASKLPTAYTGLSAQIETDRLRHALEQVARMADLGNMTGIEPEHAQAKLREIQRMAAETLEAKGS